MRLPTTTRRLRAFRLRLAAIAALALLGFAAHAFELTDTDGKRHRLADYRGKWVVVNFWATWCAPCIKEIPEIAEFQRANASRTVVLGIAMDDEEDEKVRQFARKVGHAYPLVLGDDDVEKAFGRVKVLPTTVVFDPSGKRVWDRTGTVTRKSLEDVIAGAVRGKT